MHTMQELRGLDIHEHGGESQSWFTDSTGGSANDLQPLCEESATRGGVPLRPRAPPTPAEMEEGGKAGDENKNKNKNKGWGWFVGKTTEESDGRSEKEESEE